MRVTKENILRLIENVKREYPLPKGYMYYVEKHSGAGTYYQLCITRDGYKGGDVYNLPRHGGLSGHDFHKLITGLLEAKWLDDKIKELEFGKISIL